MDQNKNNGSAPGNKWLWLPAAAVILVLVLLLSIPYGMSWVLKDWLLENGAEQVEISDIDFNPFTGVATVELLNVRVGKRNTLVIPRLMLAIDWSPFLDRRIYIRTVTIDGANMLVEQDAGGGITVGGIEIEDEGAEEAQVDSWGYGVIELDITNSVIDYRSPDLQLKVEIDDLALTELATWLARPAPVVATGTLNGAGFEIDGAMPPLEGDFGFSGRLKVTGLPLEAFADMVKPAVESLTARASLDSQLELVLGPDQPFSLRHEGVLRLEELKLAIPEERIDLQQGVALWDGTAAYVAADTADLEVDGKLHFEKTRVGAIGSNLQLASIEVLDAENISVQGMDAIKIGSVSIDTAVFAETLGETDEPGGQAGEPPPLRIASLDFGNIVVTDGKRVSIDTIHSDQAAYIAQRSKGGKWRMATIIGSLPFADKEETPVAAGQQAPDDEAASFRIGVLKNTNATLTLEDYSVSPAFKTRFNMLEVTKDIDSAKPDQDTQVYLKGNIAKYNKVEIKGTVRPFAEAFSMNLEAHIEGLEMPPYSPYAIASIGHRIDSGQLDSDSTLSIDKGKLDGTNNLTLRGLVLTPVEGEALEQMERELAVPLNKGLDMLRDKHDVIHLQLPILGDLDNPDYDASDALNQAVARATKEAAITTLTMLLQPYGSVITVARYAADKAAEIKLDPVIFSPASAEIDPARHDYLGKVAGIVKQRVNVNVRLCGVATSADRTALQGKGQETGEDEHLLSLADQREAAIKDYFINKHAIKAGRLVACQPRIDAEEGA
ncbi:MAG: DUF748 domain-containing protein, partial [Thiohalobacterales bacterium]